VQAKELFLKAVEEEQNGALYEGNAEVYTECPYCKRTD